MRPTRSHESQSHHPTAYSFVHLKLIRQQKCRRVGESTSIRIVLIAMIRRTFTWRIEKKKESKRELTFHLGPFIYCYDTTRCTSKYIIRQVTAVLQQLSVDQVCGTVGRTARGRASVLKQQS